MDYTITLSEAENKAMEYIAVDVRMEKSANDTINSVNTSSFTGTLLG